MQKISNFLSKIEENLIIVFLSAMTILTFSQVVARYVFNSGVVWALEVTTYLFAWLVLIGASYLIKTGMHITVSALVDKFSPVAAKYLTLMAVLSCMLFTGIIFYGSLNYLDLLLTLELEMQDLPIPEWYGKSVLPIGFALIFYRLFELLFRVLKGEIRTMHFAHNENLD
jgi:C4-dicarboxylate transporter DctQ subunit